MKLRLSKTFYVKTFIVLFFLVASIVVSFAMGRKFGYFLMGDIQKGKKLQAAVEKTSEENEEYSPLVSSRFKYNPEKFPQGEFKDYIAQRPDENDVLEDAATVEMTFAGKSETADELFDLSEGGESSKIEDSEDENREKKSNLVHKVHVGTFADRESAENLCVLLRQDNYKPYIEIIVEKGKKHYRVQLGVFNDEENANNLAEELRKKGYNAWTRFTKTN